VAPYAQPYGAPAPAAKSPVLSIISMITGILGIVSFGWGFIFSIAAIVLGFLGRNKEPAARGFWLTGLITGFVGIAITIIGGIILAVGVFSVINNPNVNY
jgi:ABC-type branched-subunit amino acid transport system permease subunit